MVCLSEGDVSASERGRGAAILSAVLPEAAAGALVLTVSQQSGNHVSVAKLRTRAMNYAWSHNPLCRGEDRFVF